MKVTDRVKCRINKGMFGLFFEDINYALDGGLHAEMIENRSFEFFDCGGSKYNWYKRFDGGYGWYQGYGATLKVRGQRPLNTVNPHYLEFTASCRGAYFWNKAYDGIFMTAGKKYNVSFYAWSDEGATVRVEVRNGDNGAAFCSGIVQISGGWKKYELTLRSDADVKKGAFCIVADSPCVANFDFVSMKPEDALYGVFRRDLAEALAELRPGFVRFPGGCIVEGNTLDNMYKWKLSVGAPEERKANWNRWAVHNNNGHGPYSHYNQTLGVGYYEYFLLCEHIGAKPLPVCNVGLACQYESNQKFELEDDIFKCFVQDALDLIEFANGPADSKWGAVRAKMGHKEPFGLELLGIGNEQWDTVESRFFERYTAFEKAIHAKYPEIKLIGSAGPDVTSEHYTDAWNFYRKSKDNGTSGAEFAYAIDEHYYVNPKWMIENNGFYDAYPRGINVFSGEYAAHIGNDYTTESRNCVEAAVAEASFMTGLERNADVVTLASYAPLFARVGYTQWSPDMIWFDAENVCKTPNYYVQKLFSTCTGSEELVIEGLEEIKEKGVFASASRTEDGKLFVKLVNTSKEAVDVELDLCDRGRSAKMTTLTGEPWAFNSVRNPNVTVPLTTSIELNGRLALEGMSVNVVEI